jgi:AcrR family transcriptional regulator
MARPRQFTDEKILEVARCVFLREGAAVSTQRIADELGMSQPALFKRFGNKETLLLRALLPQRIPAFIDSIGDGPDDRPIADQLVEIGTRTLALMRDLIPRINVLKSAGLDPIHHLHHLDEPPPLRHRRLTTEWLRKAHEAGRISEHDFAAVAALLLGAVHARIFMDMHAPDLSDPRSDEEYVRATVRALWCGLAPGKPCDC